MSDFANPFLVVETNNQFSSTAYDTIISKEHFILCLALIDKFSIYLLILFNGCQCQIEIVYRRI